MSHSRLLFNKVLGDILALNTTLKVDSYTGKSASPFAAPYCSTKSALNGFFGALYHELAMKKSNVSVSLCTLGLIDTESAMDKVRLVPIAVKLILYKEIVSESQICITFSLFQRGYWFAGLPCHGCSPQHRHDGSHEAAGALLPLVLLHLSSHQRLVPLHHKLYHPEQLQLHPIEDQTSLETAQFTHQLDYCLLTITSRMFSYLRITRTLKF